MQKAALCQREALLLNLCRKATFSKFVVMLVCVVCVFIRKKWVKTFWSNYTRLFHRMLLLLILCFRRYCYGLLCFIYWLLSDLCVVSEWTKTFHILFNPFKFHLFMSCWTLLKDCEWVVIALLSDERLKIKGTLAAVRITKIAEKKSCPGKLCIIYVIFWATWLHQSLVNCCGPCVALSRGLFCLWSHFEHFMYW